MWGQDGAEGAESLRELSGAGTNLQPTIYNLQSAICNLQSLQLTDLSGAWPGGRLDHGAAGDGGEAVRALAVPGYDRHARRPGNEPSSRLQL